MKNSTCLVNSPPGRPYNRVMVRLSFHSIATNLLHLNILFYNSFSCLFTFDGYVTEIYCCRSTNALQTDKQNHSEHIIFTSKNIFLFIIFAQHCMYVFMLYY